MIFDKLSFSEKIYLKAKFKLFLLLALLLLLLIYMVFFTISNARSFELAFTIIVSFFVGYFFRSIYKILSRPIDQFSDKLMADTHSSKLGIQGEIIVYSWIKDIFPKDEYFILRNYVLSPGKFDIDFIIIGPKGVFVIEVKNYSERVRFADDKYILLFDNNEIELSGAKDPRVKLAWKTESLEKYLMKKGVGGIRARKVLVFPKETGAEVSGSTGVFIISGKRSFQNYFANIPANHEMTPELRQRIYNLLIN